MSWRLARQVEDYLAEKLEAGEIGSGQFWKARDFGDGKYDEGNPVCMVGHGLSVLGIIEGDIDVTACNLETLDNIAVAIGCDEKDRSQVIAELQSIRLMFKNS